MRTTSTPDRHAPARTMQRRIRARILYRKRRDRKIAVDWLGRTFNHVGSGLDLVLVAYDPEHAMVKMRPEGYSRPPIVYSTDEFWSMLRTGILVQA